MFKIIPEKKGIISKWSGGITKELFIYPEHCNFKERDFKFRISTATTEVEESTFTKFNNMNRIISVLKGKMELKHLNHHSIILNPYDIDHFSGNWTTYSKGRVTDFNLIINNNGSGDFHFKEISQNNINTIDSKNNISFIYCILGNIKIRDHVLDPGSLCIFKGEVINYTSLGAKLFYGYVEL